MLNENRHILKEDGYIHGALDVIREILSKDKKRDLVKKKSLYERAGVKEYLTIDPETREVNCWTLKENKYVFQYTDIGKFKSSVISFQLDF